MSNVKALIAALQAEYDTNLYPKGIHVTDKELEKVQIQKADFHGEWN